MEFITKNVGSRRIQVQLWIGLEKNTDTGRINQINFLLIKIMKIFSKQVSMNGVMDPILNLQIILQQLIERVRAFIC